MKARSNKPYSTSSFLTISSLNRHIANNSLARFSLALGKIFINPILFTVCALMIYIIPTQLVNTQAQNTIPSTFLEKPTLAGDNQLDTVEEVAIGLNPDDYKPVSKTSLTPIALKQTSANSTSTADHSNLASSFSIKSIGLADIRVSYDSINNINNVNNNLRYSPIVENQMASDFCSTGKNTYLMGHSEPGSAADIGHASSYIFDRLNQVSNGQRIQATNAQGMSCTYEVESIWQLYTDSEGAVTLADFNNLMYPATNGDGILTIQTCIKGTANGRLFVRARMI